ncbi:MAG: PorT family protein [bacterium]|nr:PorT family protein [bacterium]
MTKKIFTVMVIGCVALGLMGPKLSAEVGVKGGMNLSTLNIKDMPINLDVKNKPAFQLGAFFAVPVSKTIAIQPEVYFAQRGAKGNNLDENSSGKWKLGYVEVPVLLKVTLPLSEKLKPFLIAGPYAAIKIGAKEIDDALEGDLDIADQIKTFDYGLVFGAGVSIGVGSGSIILEGRFSMGLANIVDQVDVSPDLSQLSAKNRSFCFMLGYAF